MTKTTGNFTDFVTFSRASGGTALRKISYGSELVTNGTFNTDLTGWTLSNSPAWVSGRVELSRNGGIDIVRQSFATTIGAVYRVTADVTGTSGKLGIGVSALDDSILNAGSLVNTSVDRLFVATTNPTWIYLITEVNGTSSWDNISVKEVLFDRADGTLQLFNHPTNVPRVEYDASGNLKGLLIEEARTNLVTYSNDFTNASWQKGAVTVTANDTVAPDGTSTADKVVWTATTAYHSIFATITVSQLTAYTRSVYVKYAGVQWVHIQQYDSGGGAASNYGVWFDIQNGIKGSEGTGCTGTIQDVGNGWYRCSVAFTTTAGTTTERVQIALTTGDGVSANNRLGDGTSGVYVWGAQLEAGAFPTSYIPTTGATATRAADICSIATSAFGYNQGAGTIVVDMAEAKFGLSGYPRVLEIGNSSNSGERINIYVTPNGGGIYGSSVYTSAVTQGDLVFATSITSPFTPAKSALSYRTNDSAAAYGGVLKGTDATVTILGTTYPRNTLKIGGSTVATTDQINGHIKSIAYYPRRLTNAQIQALTA